MATIRERLIYAIELVTDRAQAGVKGFRQSVAEAEGGVNKFKAGASAAMASVAANAGTLAVAGGAALVTFGAKAVQASQETALAAGRMADATGLTVEAASRLREVSADLGIAGETVQTIVQRMNKAIGDGAPAVEEYGIALQRTEDGAADVNATLIDTIRRIGAIEDPTKRAAAAQAIFGRSYAQAAELIFNSADALEQKLADVSDAKVISDEELAKAREFRDAMENLKDVGEDLGVIFGQTLVPVLSDAATAASELADLIGQARDEIEEAPGGEGLIDALTTNLFELPQKSKEAWDDLGRSIGVLPPKAGEFGAFQAALDRVTGAVREATTGVDEFGNEIVEAGDAADELGPRWSAATIPLEGATGAFAEMRSQADLAADAVEETGEAAEEAASPFDVLANALQGVKEAMDEAFGDLEDDLDQLDKLAQIEEQFAAIAEAENMKEAQTETRRLISLILDYVQSLDDIPPAKVSEIIAKLRTGDVETLRALLDDLTQDRFINIGINPPRDAFESVNAVFAPGVAPTAPTFQGTQAAIPSGPMTVNNYYPVGSTPTTVNQDLLTYYNRNGIR